MREKAQSTVEYFVVFGIIVAALIGMQVYIKRGAQARIKSYAEQVYAGGPYSPGATVANSISTTSVEEDSISYALNVIDPETGKVTHKISRTETTLNSDEVTNRLENVSALADEPDRW